MYKRQGLCYALFATLATLIVGLPASIFACRKMSIAIFAGKEMCIRDRMEITKAQMELLEGRVPETANEVVVSEYFLSTYGNNDKIGDTVTLDTESFHGDYVVTGIMDSVNEKEAMQHTGHILQLVAAVLNVGVDQIRVCHGFAPFLDVYKRQGTGFPDFCQITVQQRFMFQKFFLDSK